MGILRQNPGFSGAVAKTVVVKQYKKYGAVLTKYPDMSKVVRTEKQKAVTSTFAKAVAYARDIISNPDKKKAFAKKLEKGVSVYHAAIREFLNNPALSAGWEFVLQAQFQNFTR